MPIPIKPNHRHSLDRTYEELKQVLGNKFDHPHLRLDRTYEELKLTSNVATFPVGSRLDRTYEELKPHIATAIGWAARKVWIVPMRN